MRLLSQIFVEFPFESEHRISTLALGMMPSGDSFPDHPVCELCSPQGTQHSMQSTRQHPPHFSVVSFTVLFDCWFPSAILPFCHGKSQGNSHAAPRVLLALDSNRLRHGLGSLSNSKRLPLQLCGLSPSASLPPAPPPPCPEEKWWCVCPAAQFSTPHAWCPVVGA